jgi:pyruvate/2-oxoglutarate dehydrogenase complex dihydrolipoamide acyltransferase (E2) component
MARRDGAVEVRAFPARRRIVTGAIRAGRRMAHMHGLVDVDVTEAHRHIRSLRPAPSFTAYVVACVARAVAMHPEMHAYRDWRGRLVLARHVDVAVLVETSTPAGPVPVGHVIHDADLRRFEDISAEIRAVQANRSNSSSRRLFDRSAVAARIPGAIPAFLSVMRRSVRLHAATGTVAVSSLGMFAGGGGFGIGVPTLLTLGVTVGGMSERPRVVNGRIQARQILDLTISVDHSVVDGAPAARFVAELRELMESARLCRPGAVAPARIRSAELRP